MKFYFTFSMCLFYLGISAQSFDESLVYFNTDGGTQHGIAAADFDNDGLKDVLMASANPNVFWVKNLGNNTFGPKIELFDDEIFGNSTKPIDINNDGNMDVAAVCSFSNIVVTILGNGDGTFEEPVVIETNLEPLSDLKVFDINQDGFDDLAYSTYSSVDQMGSVYWSKNDGNGSFFARRIIAPNALETNNIEFADLDNDQLPDLISKSYWDDKFAWFRNMGNDNFSAEIEIRSPISTIGSRPMFAVDLDSDNDIDLLTYENNEIAIYNNDGTGNFSYSSASISSFSWGISAADFNHDGVVDIFCGSGSDELAVVLYGNGDGTFQDEVTLTSDIGQIIDIWIVDMDDNGTLDILTASSLYEGYLLLSNQNVIPSSSTNISNALEVNVFPNPTLDKVSIETDKSIMYSLELFDISGRSVFYKTLENSNHAEISTASLIKGYYAMIIKDDEGKIISRHKIIKQ